MSAVFILVARRSLSEVFREDYIRTARAKGLREWTVVRRHAAKSAMIPFVTIVGITVAGSLAGAVLIESVFNYPGFGQLFLQGVSGRDYYVVESGLIVIMAAMIAASFFRRPDLSRPRPPHHLSMNASANQVTLPQWKGTKLARGVAGIGDG